MIVRGSAYARSEEMLDPIRAWAVLRPFWEETVQAFAHKGFPEPASTRVEIERKWHDTCRHHAATRSDGRLVGYAPQTADLDPSSISAIMAHEAGHIVDLTNPGVYWFRPAERVPLRQGARVVSVFDVEPTFKDATLFRFERMPHQQSKHMRDWERVHSSREEADMDEVEHIADALAEFVLGKRLGYVGSPECLIQAVGEGIDRPKGLR
jgi:hypothetical protein